MAYNRDPKYYAQARSMFAKFNNNCRPSIQGLVLCCLIGAMTFMLYLSDYSIISSGGGDRAVHYNIKVIPDSLTDQELDKLPPESFSFLAMIDAGSSGCRAHVFRYGKLGSIDGPLYVLPLHQSLKVKPGLSSFASNPEAAGPSLQGLIDYLKLQVPQDDWNDTPIFLKATAGLRMLPKAQTDAILGSVRGFLSDQSVSPFLFESPVSWARVISGSEEGAFGWLAFNLLKHIVGPKKSNTGSLPYTVVEMGGASTQVTQRSPGVKNTNALPNEFKFGFSVEGERFDMYTHSYLGYGAEQARGQLNDELIHGHLNGNSSYSTSIMDPCLNKGYANKNGNKDVYAGPTYAGGTGKMSAEGAGDGLTCFHAMSHLLRAKAPAKCTVPGPHSLPCVHQPGFISDSSNFLIFENFFYASSGADVRSAVESSTSSSSLPSSFPLITSVQKMKEAAHTVCSKSTDEMSNEYPKDSQPKDVNLKLCFSVSYAAAFLAHGLHLPETKLVTVQKDVTGCDIEWVLGAAYQEASEMLRRNNLRIE